MPSRGSYAKGSARREEILEVARRVIAEKGYHRTTLRGIGRELGLEPANILYYFGSRDGLLREVIERWDAGNIEALNLDADSLELYATAIRRNVAIRGIVHLYLAFATEAVDADHPAHDFFRDRFASVVHELAVTLRVGQDAGQVRADVDPERASRLLIALADGLQLQALMDPSIDAPGDLEAAMDELFVDGARSRIARPSESAGRPAQGSIGGRAAGEPKRVGR